jgi:hypothetical protein
MEIVFKIEAVLDFERLDTRHERLNTILLYYYNKLLINIEARLFILRTTLGQED